MTENDQPDPQQPAQPIPSQPQAQPAAAAQPADAAAHPAAAGAAYGAPGQAGYYGAVPPGGFYGASQPEAEPPEGWQAAYHKAKKRSNIFLISTIVLAATTLLAGISAFGLGIAALASNSDGGRGYSRMDGPMPYDDDHMFGDDGTNNGKGNGNGNGMRPRSRTAEPTPSATASVPSATPSATATPTPTATP